MSYVSIARKRWPKAIWIIGNGPWASLSECPPGGTVILFQTEAEAQIAKRTIDSSACGGSCRRKHSIVKLENLRKPPR
jgi:hypothetical protein